MQSSNLSGASAGSQLFDTIVIGGGQAGLAAGYFLARAHQNFSILDGSPQTGTSWRNRWDSLRLFTPQQLNGLPGLPFPGRINSFPTKDEVADYLEHYAEQFDLPVRCNTKVDKLARRDGMYEVSAGPLTFLARNVIVANGPYHVPTTPSFAGELSSSIPQMHSSAYRNPAQVSEDKVLVVGAGNSGTEIALELANHGRHVWLSGRDVGRLPINGGIARVFAGKLAWSLMSRVLTVHTPMGRRARANFLHRGHPLGRATRADVARAGIEMVPRLSGVEAGKPRLDDGRVLPAERILWATGYRPSYNWIDLPILGDDGYPAHRGGVVTKAPGLYFVGLPFQTAITSSLLGGVGRDAEFIVRQITARSAS